MLAIFFFLSSDKYLGPTTQLFVLVSTFFRFGAVHFSSLEDPKVPYQSMGGHIRRGGDVLVWDHQRQRKTS